MKNPEAFVQAVAEKLGFDPRPVVQRAIALGWVTPPPPSPMRLPRPEALPPNDDALVYGSKQAAALVGVSVPMLRAMLPGQRVGRQLKAWRAGDLRGLVQQRQGQLPDDDDALVFGAKRAAALVGVTEAELRAAVPWRLIPRYGIAWSAGELRRFKQQVERRRKENEPSDEGPESRKEAALEAQFPGPKARCPS
jgi:hypothetical protein